jgi:hypothetical protein
MSETFTANSVGATLDMFLQLFIDFHVLVFLFNLWWPSVETKGCKRKASRIGIMWYFYVTNSNGNAMWLLSFSKRRKLLTKDNFLVKFIQTGWVKAVNVLYITLWQKGNFFASQDSRPVFYVRNCLYFHRLFIFWKKITSVKFSWTSWNE